MMKKLILFSFFLLLSLSSFGQTTTVSGTVTDAQGQAWANGNWTALLIIPAAKTGSNPLLNGVPIDCAIGHQCNGYSGNLDGTGSLSQVLASNNQITPSGTTWKFTICPNASSNCVSTNITISGGSQSISSTLSTLAGTPQVTPQPTLARAYRDAEVQTAPGQVWLDVSLSVIKYVKADGTIGTVGSGGGGGTPGGLDTQVQVNQGGAFAGFNSWTFNYLATPLPVETAKASVIADQVGGATYVVGDFNWTQSPSGSITVGANTVTLTPCPKGVAGSNSSHNLWIAGTGTPEAVMITGGTCTSAAGTGTITFNAVGTHSAGFTIATATGGLKEASEFAKYTPLNPSGTPQLGVVKAQANTAISILATAYLTSTSQTVDLAGAIVECSVANNLACLKIGVDSPSIGFADDFTLMNVKCRAMVASIGPCIETNAQNTRIYRVSTRNAFSGGYFGSVVQIDDDQGFELDGLFPGGSWSRCDATFCSVAVLAPGPFNTFSSVAWLHHLNLSGNCGFNGVKYEAGNTAHISDSVIQGYPQFGIWTGTRRGGFGQTQVDNVYEEIGNCFNPVGYDATNFPLGLGQMGIIDYEAPITIRGGEGPSGRSPTYNSAGAGGANIISYYVVGHSVNFGTTPVFFIGSASPTNGSNILGEFPQLCQGGTCGTVTYDILSVVNVGCGIPCIGAPVGTGNFAVPGAQGITGSCVNTVCSFTDTRVALTSYTVFNTTSNGGNNFWEPSFTFLGGSVIYSKSGDGSSAITNGSNEVQFVGPSNVGVANFNGLHSFLGSKLPTFLFNNCVAGQGGGSFRNSPFLYTCPFGTVSPIGNSTAPQGATLIYSGNPSGGNPNNAGKKGSVIWENSVVVGPSALMTFSDIDFAAKIAADSYGRPNWDQQDADMGYDTTGTNVAAGLYWRAPGSLSEYINVIPTIATNNWVRRITATNETLKVPLVINSTSNQLTITNTNNLVFNFAALAGNRTVSVADPLGNATLPLVTGSITNGDCLKFSGTTGQVIDTGAGCGGLTGLTPNVLLKALTSSTATNSSITDNGTTVSTTEPISVAQQGAGLNYIGSYNDSICQWNQGGTQFFQFQMISSVVTLNVNNGGCVPIATTSSTFPLSQLLGGIAPSGQTYDFSAVTLFKSRIGAALSTSTAGDSGFDTTNSMWHFYSGAADAIIPVMLTTTASAVTNGQCAIYSVSGNTVQLGAQTCVSGGTVSANSGSAGAIGRYAAAGGSTTIGPDTLLTDNGTTLVYTGTGGLVLPNGSGAGTYTLSFAAASTFGFYSKTAAQIVLGNSGTDIMSFLTIPAFQLGSGGSFRWASTAASSGSADLTMCRSAANILQIGTTVCNSNGTIILAKVGTNQIQANAAAAPTCAFTSGGGTTPSCALDTGSSDAGGSFTATTGTGSPANNGALTLTFAAALGTNGGKCTFTLSDVSAGQWNARATAIGGAFSTASAVINWDNNGVALSTSTAYKVIYHCYGN